MNRNLTPGTRHFDAPIGSTTRVTIPTYSTASTTVALDRPGRHRAIRAGTGG